ncbi:MAG: DNA polymerase III subunit delta [Actinomycetota bacterium]|nr:DNA polymerase III subunit delta [Actinomycetota bacterium]
MAKKNKKEIKPVFLIYSKERLLLEEAIGRLKERLDEEASSKIDFEMLRGGEVAPDHLLQALNSGSLFSANRLVLVDQADRLEVSDEVLSYIENPMESTYLVLMAEKFDKRSRLYKLADRLGYAFEYKPPSRSELPDWVKKRFLDKGAKVSLEAAQYLCSNVDNDLMVLSGEIEKVLLYNMGKKEISLSGLKPLITKSFEMSVFELVELIGERKKTESFTVLRTLIAQGQAPSYLFHMILRQFRLILKTKVLLERRALARSGLAAALKLPPFVVLRYEKQSKRFSFGELTRVHSHLLAADVELKSGKKAADLILEMLIEKIIEES